MSTSEEPLVAKLAGSDRIPTPTLPSISTRQGFCATTITNMLTIFLDGLTAIYLFVGGIGIIATIFSTAVGLFFGIYPNNHAGNLEPAEALRHE